MPGRVSLILTKNPKGCLFGSLRLPPLTLSEAAVRMTQETDRAVSRVFGRAFSKTQNSKRQKKRHFRNIRAHDHYLDLIVVVIMTIIRKDI